MPERVIDFTIWFTALNCLSSAFTCWVLVPLPVAMRIRREPLMIPGFSRSLGVIEQMIASTRPSSPSSISRVAQLLGHAGEHPDDVLDRAHLAHLAHLVEEVVEGELPLAQLLLRLHRLIGVERGLGLLDEREHVAHAEDAAREPVGVERLERRRAFSPMPAYRIGRPVTSFTDSAAPPRASPSSFVRMTPVSATRSANVSATFTAS